MDGITLTISLKDLDACNGDFDQLVMVAMIRGNTHSLELSVGEVLQLKGLLDRVNTPSFKYVQDRLESMEVPDDIE